MKRKDFIDHAKLKNTWNRIYTFEYEGKEYNIGTVQWHCNKEWKLVSTKDFDNINDRDNKEYVLYECHTQQELWEFMRDNVLAV